MSAQPSDRARKAAWLPGNYTAAEVSDARSVIDHWNRTFTDVVGAPRAQTGNHSNARAYVRMIRDAARAADSNDGDAAFAAITAATVRDAITAYRHDAGCQKLQRWKSFRDWLDAERVLQYAAIAKSRGLVARPEPTARERAEKIVWHLNLIAVAGNASARNMRLSTYIEASVKDCQRVYDSTMQSLDTQTDPGLRRDLMAKVCTVRKTLESFEKLHELAQRRKAVAQGWPRPQWNGLCNRAIEIFTEHNRRHPRMDSSDARDTIAVNAIILALLDLENPAGQGSRPKVRIEHG